AAPLEAILKKYKTDYEEKYMAMMRSKLGLQMEEESDIELIENLQKMLQLTETDMTIFFRNLSKIKRENQVTDNADFLTSVKDAFYKPEELSNKNLSEWKTWFEKYLKRLSVETITDEERQKIMNTVNPKYVLRNY